MHSLSPPGHGRHRAKSDLIDLSPEADKQSHGTANAILDLFDPLNKPPSLLGLAVADSVAEYKALHGKHTGSANVRARPTPSTISRSNQMSLGRDRRLRAASVGPSLCQSKPTSLTDPSRTSLQDHPTVSSIRIERGHVPDRDSDPYHHYHSNHHHDQDRQQLEQAPPPPLVPPVGPNTVEHLRLFRKHQRSGRELVLLAQKIKDFRAKFKHSDLATNPGIIYAPRLLKAKPPDMSVKLVITSPLSKAPLNFTCNISTSVEHLIMHAVCSVIGELKDDHTANNYLLKVTGKDEYFDARQCLADYSLVAHCLKFELDVELTLVALSSLERPYLRTAKDDFRCKSLLCPDDLLSRTAILRYSDLNYENLSILLDAFDREAKRLHDDVSSQMANVKTQSLLQATKAICSSMLSCETDPLTRAKNNLVELCKSYRAEASKLEPDDRYKMIEVIQHAIKGLLSSMRNLLSLTSRCLPVDYEIEGPDKISTSTAFVDTPSTQLRQQVSLHVQLVAQLKPDWLGKYGEFYLQIQVIHGERELCDPVRTDSGRIESSLFARVLFDQPLTVALEYNTAPRETRLALTLFGVEQCMIVQPNATGPNATPNHLSVPVIDDALPLRRSLSASSVASTTPMYSSDMAGGDAGSRAGTAGELVHRQLATALVYLFDHELNLCQGERLLHLSPLSEDDAVVVPELPHLETIASRDQPIVLLELQRFAPEKRIFFAEPEQLGPGQQHGKSSRPKPKNYEDLGADVRHLLEPILAQSRSCTAPMADDERALLWEHRANLMHKPDALPKVLLSAPSWAPKHLAHIYLLLEEWAPLEPADAFQLLLAPFADQRVRALAVERISHLPDDELYDYLPQLMQAFRYEKRLDCALLWLLMDRCLCNARIATLAYWQLKLLSKHPVAQQRAETLNNCLLWLCGSAFWQSVDNQEQLLSQLATVAGQVKQVRDGKRAALLARRLERIQDFVAESKPSLPWAPSLRVCDLDLRSCSYFASNTVPLKLAFRTCERSCDNAIKFHTYESMFKQGDDLRQDMLAMQMIRIMEKLWLREGLDLCMVTFECLATDERQGMLEMVTKSETLRKIQQNSSLIAGPFNSRAIDNYIKLWNTNELEYKAALDKFLRSCAGYSVATYVLGICDRHNDNIMVTTSGHLFHIDFGKFLGDAQMMGAIKRDRTPFVLSADMAYVINGGDKPSKRFQSFVELCTQAFNIVRRHRGLFLDLFGFMAGAHINGLGPGAVHYIDKALMPGLSECEAMARFTRLIDECLKSRFTQMNFFIHNLAQLRFTTDSNGRDSLLSFVPKTFTMASDGRIESLSIVHVYKKYEPEKTYYYRIRVQRAGQLEPSDIVRTFDEFTELQMKLACMYPHQQMQQIDRSTGSLLMDLVGRRNTREIAHRRLEQLGVFLRTLLALPGDLAHCDIIYTFFHPILRDHELLANDQSFDVNNMSLSQAGPSGLEAPLDPEARRELYLGTNGQVKLRLAYQNSTLDIMIMHAKNLACPDQQALTGPNCYAKTYLLPDPRKQSKRKTRIIRQSCHPSFMELIVYNISPERLPKLTLQVSIWHYELVQCKSFMGAALVPLDSLPAKKETISWYPLKNF